MRRGFTLIETLVAISVIGLLVAIVLPAVQAAREAARRAQCSNNLRQLGIGWLAYHESQGCFPPGRLLTYDPRYTDAALPCLQWIRDRSAFVAVLPYLDQAPLYSSINQSVAILSYENHTIFGVSLGTLACPSDPLGGRERIGYPLLPLSLQRNRTPMGLVSGSYVGCQASRLAVALPDPTRSCQVDPWQLREADGVLTDTIAIRAADIRDGLSRTILGSERALEPQRILDGLWRPDDLSFTQTGWWFLGEMGDTLFTAFYPPNAYRRFRPQMTAAWRWSASSLHPGGVNVLYADGSCGFVGESIQTLKLDPDSGVQVEWPTKAGVWQALATRAGGEVIPDDSLGR